MGFIGRNGAGKSTTLKTMLNLMKNDGGEVSKDMMQSLIDVLTTNLRSNDVMAPNGKNQVILILTDITPENGHTPIDRIMNMWEKVEGREESKLTYETEGMS